MALDLVLQALPEHGPLLDDFRAGRLDAELLAFLPSTLSRRPFSGTEARRFAQGDPQRLRFLEALRILDAQHPGLPQRSCFLGRRFDWIQWVLDTACHRTDGAISQPDSLTELGRWAVRGAGPWLPGACGVQGIPVAWNAPSVCYQIADWLESLDLHTLAAEADLVAMDAAGLYKWDRHDGDLIRRQLGDDLAALGRFYAQVRQHPGEGVLIVLD